MYNYRLMQTSAASIPWQDVDTVLLDMDGTLLDLAFDNYFWLELVPARPFLDRLDAVVFTGGDDPVMEAFGEPTHPLATPIDPARQEYELALLDWLEHDHPAKPVLGVCLGMQLMALHAGGSLNQHMPDDVPTHEHHRHDKAHNVRPVVDGGPVAPGLVTSHHRQAVRDAGAMRVVAVAEDGVVEAIDDRTRVDYRLTPILDLMSLDAHTFADNPALKLPILRRDDDYIYGTLNICRVFAGDTRVGWPESFDTPLLMNAHELLAHAMAAEVEVVVHEFVEKRPADNASRKRRSSLVNCLQWLDANLAAVRAPLDDYPLTFFEVCLYCLVEHFPFRNPVDVSRMVHLRAFVAEFGTRPSAQATPYRFDQ